MLVATHFQKNVALCLFDLLLRKSIHFLESTLECHSGKVIIIRCRLFTLMAVFQVVSVLLSV